MKINREYFYSQYRKYFGRLKQAQVDGLNFLLGKLENSKLITNRKQWAYVLATIKHETGVKGPDGKLLTFHPITEVGSVKYLTGKAYYPYIGRGFVQLTWIDNYRKFANLLKIPLVEKPELANDPETAWQILELGMSKGLYTGKKLSDYINKDKTDYLNARRIINSKDKWYEIKKIAESFEKCLI